MRERRVHRLHDAGHVRRKAFAGLTHDAGLTLGFLNHIAQLTANEIELRALGFGKLHGDVSKSGLGRKPEAGGELGGLFAAGPI